MPLQSCAKCALFHAIEPSRSVTEVEVCVKLSDLVFGWIPNARGKVKRVEQARRIMILKLMEQRLDWLIGDDDAFSLCLNFFF